MIIEFFGAPTVGKTTVARKLADCLRAAGHHVDLVLSYRPAEVADGESAARRRTAGGRSIAAIQRIARPMVESVRSRSRPAGTPPPSSLATELLALLPAESLLWSVRLRQYIARLDRAWHIARASHGVTVFDQGFIQALCSLVLLGRAPSAALAAQALAILPRADIVIRLDAPPDVLQARLHERFRNQAWLERLLELDLDTNLRTLSIVDMISELLRCSGRTMITVGNEEVDAAVIAIKAQAQRFLCLPLRAVAS
jgi:thymidylate kinase